MYFEPQYLHDWKEHGRDGMISDFGISEDRLSGMNILVASYTYECWSGDAYVLLEQGGTLYEVHGSHCSCFGLSENGIGGETTQFQPDPVTPAEIRHRLEKGTWGEEDKIREITLAALEAFERHHAKEG